MKSLPWYLRDALFLIVLVGVLIGLAYLLDAIPISGMAYYNRIIVMMGINITLAVSLNIINGHAGQFSLGHAGFMAVGAYFASFPWRRKTFAMQVWTVVLPTSMLPNPQT